MIALKGFVRVVVLVVLKHWREGGDLCQEAFALLVPCSRYENFDRLLVLRISNKQEAHDRVALRNPSSIRDPDARTAVEFLPGQEYRGYANGGAANEQWGVPARSATLRRHSMSDLLSGVAVVLAALGAFLSGLAATRAEARNRRKEQQPQQQGKSDQPKVSRRGPILLLLLAIVCFVAAVGIALVWALDDEPSGSPPLRQLPARVLLAIDTSSSMGCPRALLSPSCPSLKGGDDRLRRIELVDQFAPSALGELAEEGDELGAVAFSTFGKNFRSLGDLQAADDSQRLSVANALRKLREREDSARQLRQRADRAAPATARRLEAKADQVDPTRGGTPLYEMISRGVRELQLAGAGTAVNSLVVLTDGTDFSARLRSERVRLALKGAADPGNPVRVIVTATSVGTCAPLKEVIKPFDGRCLPGRTDPQIEVVREDIRKLLRKKIEP